MKLAAPLVLALVLASCKPSGPSPLQGYIEGEYVRVAAPFAGTLVKLDTKRGDAVQPGTPLFALEAENEDAARREAEARVRQAEANLENLRKGKRPSEIDMARAQLAQAEATAAFSEKDLARQLDLVARGFVSHQAADAARAVRDRDRDKVAEMRNQLATTVAGARPDEIRAAEAEVNAAREALAQADWKLRQKSVASTAGGTVTDTLFVQGEWVPSGSPVVSILPPGNVKIRFFVPEPDVGRVQVGQRVRVSCDACGAPFDAAVSFVAPQAEFTPPVIYSKESRAKLVFLVEARAASDVSARLHPGQPVDVRLP
ncbi:MAG TPA: HlyD family efflux transporter periplasmic adaptor subunit [Usitatibacter sp.]|jgi:HlyD family secretion protein|nr:HlyD family efflux transporter periplasmic adaptor subunit [Usitatibacter sp.]